MPPMRTALAIGCVTGVFTAPLAAQTDDPAPRPSNFRMTSMVTGGTLSIDFDHLFEQQLRTVTVQGGPAAGSALAPELEGSTVTLRLGAAWADDSMGIEVWGLIGADDLQACGTAVNAMGVASQFDADRDVALVLGAGLRHRFFDIDGFSLFLAGWARWSLAEADVQVSGSPTTQNDMQVVSWQGSLYATYQFKIGDRIVIAPYGGVIASGADVTTDAIVDSYQRDVLGALGGVELGITSNVSLFVEGRFISQTAVAGGLAISF